MAQESCPGAATGGSARRVDAEKGVAGEAWVAGRGGGSGATGELGELGRRLEASPGYYSFPLQLPIQLPTKASQNSSPLQLPTSASHYNFRLQLPTTASHYSFPLKLPTIWVCFRGLH